MDGHRALSVRKLFHRAFVVYPELLRDLAAFERDWRRMAASTPTYDDGEQVWPEPAPDLTALWWTFELFQKEGFRLNATFRIWQNIFGKWKAENNGTPLLNVEVRSPYYHHEPAPPSTRGAPDGENPWLDRFLFAVEEVTQAYQVVLALKPRTRERTTLPVAQLEPDLQAALLALKAEYAALFALSRHAPCARLPDPSRAGRDPASKWFAGGGTFVVYSPALGMPVPLTDPGGLSRALLAAGPAAVYAHTLDSMGRVLVEFPGFGAETVAGMSASVTANMVRAIADLVANHGTNPF